MNRRCKVLVADDERQVAAGLQGQLEALNYDIVAVVDDGHRAMAFHIAHDELPVKARLGDRVPDALGSVGIAALQRVLRHQMEEDAWPNEVSRRDQLTQR